MSRTFRPFVDIDGDGPTVVLVHGGWTDHHTWAFVAPDLARDHRVITYDRRGHSSSVWPDPVSRRQDEDDLAWLIESLGSPAHVVGNSYGASISLGLAGRRPELVGSLAVHEPPLLGIARPGTPLAADRAVVMAVASRVAFDVAAGRADAGARRFVEEVAIGPGAWPFLPPEVQATMVANAHTFVGMLEDPSWDAVPPAPPASVPVLLSDGSTSPAWLRAVADELAAAGLPQARRLTFEGAGHVPHLTHPTDYTAAIRSFVASQTLEVLT